MSTTTTSLNLPTIGKKWPDKTDFSTDIEVDPSNEIDIRKLKKDSKFNFILIFDSPAVVSPSQKSQFNS